MSADPLADLVLRLAEQEREALREVYDAAAGKLFAVALRLLKDRAEAEEALQEIFTRIWLRAKSFDPEEGRAMAWMIALARDHALDRLRARPEPPPTEEEAEAAPSEAGGVEDAAPGGVVGAVPGTVPGTVVEARVVPAGGLRRGGDCLARLDPERAAALRAAYLDGLSCRELARRHAIPPSTIRPWLRRSLSSLRECLGK